ncbi:ABC transporter permease subunit [Micrococcaceae bacterium Sec5.1]
MAPLLRRGSLVSPFGIYLMRVYAADAVSDSLIEAARVNGAGEFRIFWQVGFRLPSSSPPVRPAAARGRCSPL